jgi:hypothetical protein
LLSTTTVFFLFSSCKQKIDYSKEISQLDSALAALTATEKILLDVDTGALRTSYNAIAEDLQLTEKLSKDTVKKKTAMLLSIAYEQSGNMHNLLENRKYLERAVTESKQRISDLKHDLAENLIDKNKAMEYIVNELKSTEKICDAVNKSIEKAKMSATKLDSLKTEITFLADSLRSK